MNKTSTAAAQARPSRIDPDLLPDPPRVGRKRRADQSDYDKRGLWRKHIKRTLNDQYGCPLPDDNAGRECFALLCHAAFAGSEQIASDIAGTAAMWADWLTPSDLDALTDEVANRPRELSKKKIGAELGLTKDTWWRVEAWSLWPIRYTYADWKRDKAERDRQRAARNRASNREMSKKDQCIDFLRKALACGPAPAARLLSQAVTLGLLKPGAKVCGKPMRAAYEAIGVERDKMGLRGGWWWGLPQAEKRPETPDFSGDDLSETPETPAFLEVALPERSETPGFLEVALSDEKTPAFLEVALFRSGIEENLNGRTLVGQAEPASEGAASDEQQRCGGVELLDEDEAIESEATLDLQRPGHGSGLVQTMNLDRLPSSSPALVPRRNGFGRVPIEQRWAQPMRAFARASRQERDRGWLAIMAQGDGLALQAARRRWGGVPVINQHGGEA